MIYDDPKFIPQHIEGKGNVVNNHRNIHTHQLEFWAQLEPWDLNLERRNTIGERPCSGVVNFACENVQRWWIYMNLPHFIPIVTEKTHF